MSNELLNTYIKFGEPDGDDLDFSQIADWAGYLLVEQRDKIAELEEKLAAAQQERDSICMGEYDSPAEAVEHVKLERNEYIRLLRECQQKVKELESKLASEYERGLKDQREADANIDFVTNSLGNAIHGYVCGYNDGWYRYQKAIREQDVAKRKWPPTDQTCVNCGQYLGGGVQCCSDPRSPTAIHEQEIK